MNTLQLEHPESVFHRKPDDTSDPDRVAERIKRVYVEMRSNQLGKAYHMQDRYRKDSTLWLRAAKIAIEKKVSPITFCTAMFTYNPVPGGPYPTQVGSAYLKRDIDLYLATYQDPEREWPTKYKEGKMYLRQFINNSKDNLKPVDILTSPLVNGVIDPFICCCLCPVPKVLQRHGPAACERIKDTPGLVELMEAEGIPMNWIKYVIR